MIEIPVRIAPLGYAQYALQGGAFTLTTGNVTIPGNATAVLLETEGNATIRWRDDGIAANLTLGMPLTSATMFWYTGNLAGLTFYPESGNTTLNASFYSQRG